MAHTLAGPGRRSSQVKERSGTFQNSDWSLNSDSSLKSPGEGSRLFKAYVNFLAGGALVAPSGGEANRELE